MDLRVPERPRGRATLAAESSNFRLDHPCANIPTNTAFMTTNNRMLSTMLIIVMSLSRWSFVVRSLHDGAPARLLFDRQAAGRQNRDLPPAKAAIKHRKIGGLQKCNPAFRGMCRRLRAKEFGHGREVGAKFSLGIPKLPTAPIVVAQSHGSVASLDRVRLVWS